MLKVMTLHFSLFNLRILFDNLQTQPVFTCSKSAMETVEKGVKKMCEICSKLITKTPERRH